jgi:hypothetical protein
MKKPVPVFIGPAFESRSRRFNSMRTVNLYPELAELPGKGGEIATLLSRPGLKPANTLGLGPIRGAYTLSTTQQSFIVSGSSLYSITSAAGTPVLVAGNLATTTGPVSMSNNGTHLIIVDGQFGYTVELAAPTIVTIVDANFYNGARTVAYLGGYFILDKPGSSFFFISDLDSVDFPPLNEQFAGASEDEVIGVMVNNEQLYVIGTRSIETWVLTGSSASAPFQRVRTYNVGATATHTLRRIAGTFCWLGATEEGDGIVYSMDNDTPTRISNHAVEHYLQELGDLTSTSAFALQHEGHQFYCLNIPNANSTLVYDLNTKQWCEWVSITGGNEGRCLAQTQCFLNGEHVLGDYRNGNIYTFDNTYFKDNGEPLRRLRQSPPLSETMVNLFIHQFELDAEVGWGRNAGDGVPENEVNPKVVLSISRDSGFTWSASPREANLGKIGRFATRVRWHQLGLGRNVVFRVWTDDPVDFALLQAYVDFDMGTS